MNKKEYRKNFNECNHKWNLQVDVNSCTGNASGNGIFNCEKCSTYVTLLEKCALDQLIAQNKSLTIQENHTRIGMWANIISAGILIIAALTFYFTNLS